VTAQTDFGPDDICRGQQHYKDGGLARAHVGCTFHGFDVPVAPAPDQNDEPEDRWWLSSDSDRVIASSAADAVAMFANAADAALAVSRVNAHAALTARAEHAETEVERLRGQLRSANQDVARRTRERRDLVAERDAARAELARTAAQADRFAKRLGDAARAELAAANTTDLPTVTRVDEHTLRIGRVEYLASGPAALRRRIAVHHLALAAFLDEEAARLAQEAPTTKDEE